jgi:hypothetical protein
MVSNISTIEKKISPDNVKKITISGSGVFINDMSKNIFK